MDDSKRSLGVTENVHGVDRLFQIGEARKNLLAENLASGLTGIDRKNPIIFCEKIFQHKVAWPPRVRARAHHSEAFRLLKNAGDITVGVAVVIHDRPAKPYE